MTADPLSPITRLTNEDRLIAFEKKSNEIYNRFSPYDDSGPGLKFGSKQPFVWTKISDGADARNLTRFDSQTFPFGSTLRDEQRMGKFLTSGRGLIYIGIQNQLQNLNAFNETRVYNPLSVLSATAAKASLGVIDRPKRFIETTGTAGDMVAGALLSLVSLETRSTEGRPPNGAASGFTISNQANVTSGAHKGLVRFETGKDAIGRFSTVWAAPSDSNTGGGLLKKLGDSLINKLKSTVKNTIPYLNGIGENKDALWEIRPEYQKAGNGKGAYESMLADSTGLLSVKNSSIPFVTYNNNKNSSPSGFFSDFTNGLKSGLSNALFGSQSPKRSQPDGTISINVFHRYTPDEKYSKPDGSVGSDNVTPDVYSIRAQKNIETYQIEALQSVVDSFQLNPNNRSAERTSMVNGVDTSSDYSSIPTEKGDSGRFENRLKDSLSVSKRGFSKSPSTSKSVGDSDEYNRMSILSGNRDEVPTELVLGEDTQQSKDIIFFYFYDVVNSIYIPFRASITSVNDMHSVEWDDISYLGRADKLYVYKGFSRDVNLTFTVYANSLRELVPMWERINYLVGLARPSKYTDGNTLGDQFMYPPMVTLRIGDMFVDQPCVMRSIGMTVPDDATWETQRGPGSQYSYLKGLGYDFSKYNDSKMYQLPTKVDMSINMSIMEKRRSIVDDNHYYNPIDGINFQPNGAVAPIA